MTDFSFLMFKNEECQTDGVLTHFWKLHNTGSKKVNGKNQFTKVSGIKSYYSGLQIAVTWNQTSASSNFVKTNNTKDTVKINVNGYSLFGFQVKGFRIGAKINDTWNFSHKI